MSRLGENLEAPLPSVSPSRPGVGLGAWGSAVVEGEWGVGVEGEVTEGG